MITHQNDNGRLFGFLKYRMNCQQDIFINKLGVGSITIFIVLFWISKLTIRSKYKRRVWNHNMNKNKFGASQLRNFWKFGKNKKSLQIMFVILRFCNCIFIKPRDDLSINK